MSAKRTSAKSAKRTRTYVMVMIKNILLKRPPPLKDEFNGADKSGGLYHSLLCNALLVNMAIRMELHVHYARVHRAMCTEGDLQKVVVQRASVSKAGVQS